MPDGPALPDEHRRATLDAQHHDAEYGPPIDEWGPIGDELDDVPWGHLGNAPSMPLVHGHALGGGRAQAAEDECVREPPGPAHMPSTRDGQQAAGDDSDDSDAGIKKRERADADDVVAAKRAREGAQDEEMVAEDGPAPWWMTTWQPHGTGFVTRLVSMGSDEARTQSATAVVEKEMANMLTKGVFDPTEICDWSVVSAQHPEALVGNTKMILGVKNSELPPEQWAYKGRMVFMGNNIRGAAGHRVLDTTEGLYGTPVGLTTGRLVMAVALLRDWAVEVGDVEGAYMVAKIGGPPVYVRLTPALWAAPGARAEEVKAARDPCLRVCKAMYGLPRAGFDWFAHCDEVMMTLVWQRHHGVDSVYSKPDAILAVYVDDMLLAGTPHARRREWAALRDVLKMRGEPEALSRFLGVKYSLRTTGTHTRVLQAKQAEYVRSVVARYDDVAPFPAGKHAAPAVHRRVVSEERGGRADDCRSFVGALMYIVRATRPDATHAVNRLARNVTNWTKTDDADLEHVVGYLGTTADFGLE